MKKLSFLLVLTCFFVLSGYSQTAKIDLQLQEVLQKSLDDQNLQELLESDHAEIPQQLYVATNGFLPENLHLRYAGQAVQFVDEAPGSHGKPVLEVAKLKIEDGRAVLKFLYTENKVTVRLSLVENEWMVRSSYIRGKGLFNYTFILLDT